MDENNNEEVEKIPDWKRKIMASKYSGSAFGNYNSFSLKNHFADIDERLRDLEHKVNPTAKKILSTRSQQMLLLFHLGILDKLKDFNISNKKLAKLLSILLNASPDNIEKDLSQIYNPKSDLTTVNNYEILQKVFKDAGIKDLDTKTENILNELRKTKK